MLRKALRKPAVLAALGVSNSVLYDGITRGVYPRGMKIDPAGRNVIWWEDEIIAVQKAAIERQARDAAQRELLQAQGAAKREVERNTEAAA